MNTLQIRENFAQLYREEILDGFIEALIFQGLGLDDYSITDLSFLADDQCKQAVNTFLLVACQSDRAVLEIEQHGSDLTGHDLAFQMLGHDVGFWEQKETKTLDQLLDLCLDSRVIKPFTLYYDNDTKKLEFDYC